MKVKYVGEESNPLMLISGKIYTCLGEKKGFYQVIDEENESYYYPKDIFEVVNNSVAASTKK